MRKYQHSRTTRFFRGHPDDPVGNIGAVIANGLLNIGISYGLQRVSREAEKFILGPTEAKTEDRFKQDIYRIAIQKEQIELSKAKTQELKVAEQLKIIQLKTQQKQWEYEKAVNQSANISIERTQMDLHIKTEKIISGALQTAANSTGLTGSAEQQETVREWQKSLLGRVLLILGKRGSGKTATGLTFCEFLAATFGYYVYWVAVPVWAQKYLPSWVKIVDSLDECPNDCIIFIDESGAQFLSLQFAGKRNVELRQQLMLCRQKNQTLVFCAQHSRDIDESIIRQGSCTVFKEPSLMQADSERREIRAKALKATQAFKSIPKEERLSVAYIFDENFEGLIKCSLPSFWAEEISTIYGRSGASAATRQNSYHPQSRSGTEPICLGPVVSDDEIRNLRAKGYGYERIAKTLNITVYRVRQCLAGHDPLNGVEGT